MMEVPEPSNLADAMLWQIERVVKIRNEYLKHSGGAIAAKLMSQDISVAIQAQASGDIIKIITAYEKLKEYEL